MRRTSILLCALLLAAATPAPHRAPHPAPHASPRPARVAHFDHIFMIVEENKSAERIVGDDDAPALTALAKQYGYASRFYAESHPSEPNYVAMVGGSTYGIRDDDAYYCHANDTRPSCSNSRRPGYVDHTIDRPSLASLIDAKGLTWKNYDEDLPAPGSLAVSSHLYASKHDGFINYLSVQKDPKLAQKMVGFDRLYADLRTGDVPTFSLIVPNLCDEMHGTGNPLDGLDCSYAIRGKLIGRGDANAKRIVDAIMASPVWRAKGNSAIVITFDEDDGGGHAGCCGNDPNDPANAGGGHIATLVITNHGPRGVVDPTPYSHYSLLRTIQDALGLRPYLGRADAPGVVPMIPLFGAAR
ncbi:MAG TPA: alkaline phosphatase family protein [Candidatus Baltobacteraceae bacterium]|jgi:hypothetical protein